MEWTRRRTAESWVTGAVVVGSVLFIFSQLRPGLLFLDTTAAGGDMGAHVWGPAFLRDELLPKGRLSGWAPDWYDGFPAYQFYMVVPSLLIVLLDVVFFLPYNVAFKLITVSGLLALPVAAWAMGRLARLPFPVPAALAVATVPFVFDRSFSIYGGNAASTLAGEFAFTISLVFAVVFLGAVLRGLDSGRSRGLAAVMLGLTVLCHLIPAIFALVGAGVALVMSLNWKQRAMQYIGAVVAVDLLLFVSLGPIWMLLPTLPALAYGAFWLAEHPIDIDRGSQLRGWWLASVVGVGTLITGFWTVPFVLRRAYLNDMGWEKLTNYLQMLMPGRLGLEAAHIAHWISASTGGHPGPIDKTSVPGDLTWVIALAILGMGTSLFFRRRFGTWLTGTALVLAVLVVITPQARLWNARILPFWYLCLFFLAALAVVEIIQAVAVLASKVADQPRRGVLIGGPIAMTLLVIAVVALPLRSLPFGHTSADGSKYSWGLIHTKDNSYVPGWAEWNYSGYQRKDNYPEYKRVISTMADVGKTHGCGRAMWEYNKDLDRFGTPMALMLLPYFTDRCIDSMEGLYFEASATTPYHFLNQSELSGEPSRAQRDLPYGSLDVPLGINHLQLLGVRYYMAFSDEAVRQADADTDLTPITTIPLPPTVSGAAPPASARPWHVYQVAGSAIVQPLSFQPAVVTGVPKGGQGWQDMAVDWYLDRARWGVMQSVQGPKTWQRIKAGDIAEQRKVSPTTVSEVKTDTDRISFKVDRTGAPILVKASYFPNWKVKGAEGPFRVAPNLMVVIPTDNIVSLHYGRTTVDWLGIVLTLIGIALAVAMWRGRRLAIPPRPPRASQEPPPPPAPQRSDDELATVGGGQGERWGPPPEGFEPPA